MGSEKRTRLGGKKTLKVNSFLNEFAKEKIKEKVDIVALLDSFGVKLEKKGEEYKGLCPFHEETEPSFSVNREKGMYHCFGCGAGGDCFTLVEKMKKTDFKGALAFLKEASNTEPAFLKRVVVDREEPGLGKKQKEEKALVKAETKEAGPGQSQEKQAEEAPLSHDTGPGNVELDRVCEYYHKRLYNHTKGVNYLTETRGIARELIPRFKIGVSDGGLLKLCSNGQRENLKKLGILNTNEKGEVWEHFAGCLTFPIMDKAKRVVHIYGRKIVSAGINRSHLYLAGSHMGVFNLKASQVYDHIILVESILDCLSLITLGIENVQPLYGVGTLSGEHLEILKQDRVKMVVLGFDNDKAGEAGEKKHRATLLKRGFGVKTVHPPVGKDWNDSLLVGVDKKNIVKLIEEAELITPVLEEREELKVSKDNLRYVFTLGEISYRLLGVKEMFVSSLRVNVKAQYGEEKQYNYLDLYSALSRSKFAANLAELFGFESKIIEKHLIRILEYLEEERDRNLNALRGESEKIEVSEEERGLAIEYLTDPDMPEIILRDMEELGYVGEELNKLLLYIGASSRKMDDPISILIISRSSAGKSYLVDTVKKLIPEEDVVSVTSLSDQALNYIPDGGLKHKFLILGEAVHSDVIEHQIREMLSSHELSRMVTIKDDKTGGMISRNLRSECIVSAVMSTTRYEVNPENASRCFLINADESEEQTKRIHELQRNKYSLERHFARKKSIPEIIKKHKAAQRLLEKILVVNPFGQYLDFPIQLLRTRRDHERFMDLIACTCFLRQYQKDVKTRQDAESDEEVRYIECDMKDYEISYRIMVEGVLSSTFSELPPNMVKLYEEIRVLIHKLGKEKKLKPLEVSVTQRDIRSCVRWLGGSSIKQSLRKLVYLEYLQLERGGIRGSRNAYRLQADEPIEKLDYTMIPPVEEIRKRMESGHSGQKWAMPTF